MNSPTFETGLAGNKGHIALLILRISFGISMLIGHGIPKLNKIVAGDLGFADPIGLGPEMSLYLITFAEFLCSILLILGSFTRLSLIPLMIAMFVAAFVVNAGASFVEMEKAIMYLAGFTVIMITGPGKYSFDEVRKANKP